MTFDIKYLLSMPEKAVEDFGSLKQLDNSFVSSDPKGQRIGSGGGTVHLLREAWQVESNEISYEDWLEQENKCIIHGGGQSRRLPAYSVQSKLLIPIPVHRWARGQSIDQCLIDLQLPFFNKLLEESAPSLNSLIASGDALVHTEQAIGKIPEADVVCIGLWSSIEKAKNHGVFFTDSKSPESLDFMLQKPNEETIQTLAHDKYFLIDAGIWLLSTKAQKILSQKSQNENGDLQFYDLYSDFGLALGQNASKKDDEINSLTCAVKILDEAKFLHFGTNEEIISSSQALQNETLNQKRLFNIHGQKHCDIFQQNCLVEQKFDKHNEEIWIENSFIPKSWSLSKQNVLTGIPKNHWELKLSEEQCLDIIPLKNRTYCLRAYGINDKFKGAFSEAEYLGQNLKDFFVSKNILEIPKEIELCQDLQESPLFPCFKLGDLNSGFIQWIFDKSVSKEHSHTWLSTRRVSASEIQELCDLKAVEKQRRHYRTLALPKLAQNYKNSVFYQLNLKELSSQYPAELLPENIHSSESLSTLLNDAMFRSQVLRKHDIERSQKWGTRSFEILREEIITQKEKFNEPHYEILPEQIIWGRSPARIDLAGGWSDTPPYCFFFGGNVLNVAIEMNGQDPIQVFMRKVTEATITIRSIDLGISETITDYADLDNFNDVGSGFVIPKAALVLCGISQKSHFGHGYKSLKEQLEAMGGGFEITMLVAIPKGSGLGTSSILAATVLGVMNRFFSLGWDKMKVCQNTLILEQMLTTGGGWQDQFGGIYEGVKLFSTEEGFQQRPSCQYYSSKVFDDNKEKILLYYTGITRVAKGILGEIVRGLFLNSKEHLDTIHEISQHAKDTAQALLENDYNKLAACVEKSWRLNQQLDSGTNTPDVQNILNHIEDLTLGKKLLGAGGGGYLLLFAKDKDAAEAIKERLNRTENTGARFVDLEVSQKGFEVTTS